MAVVDCIRYIGSIPPFTLLQTHNVYQCLMYGMEGAGKTTLLYKLKCPGWKKEQLIKEIKFIKKDKDPGYHYEEFAGHSGFRFGIWDIPGDEIPLNIGNMFYKYLRIYGVFFVVDARMQAIENVEQMEKTRRLFEFLLNEDELRMTAFILVYNIFGDLGASDRHRGPSASKVSSANSSDGVHRPSEIRPEVLLIRQILGVQEVCDAPQHRGRFHEISLNCADVDTNSWREAVDHMRSVIKDSEM